MQILIISVGKRPEAAVQDVITDYEKRLSRDYQVHWQYVQSSNQHDESDLILKQLVSSDQVILLDERGEQKNNQEFTEIFERLASSHGRLVFVIGGAYGVTEKVRQRANFVWSLSKLVFPHRLIRLVLIEQLYRTVMVSKGHPYHHD